MVKFSNKPNVRGIKNTSSSIDYSSKLIAREGKLFAGLMNTRAMGIALGLVLAIVLMIIVPFIAKLCGL